MCGNWKNYWQRSHFDARPTYILSHTCNLGVPQGSFGYLCGVTSLLMTFLYRSFIIFLLFSGAYTIATAQSNINGVVMDETGKPLDLATVLLRALPDSGVVQRVYTEPDGTFTLNGVANGRYCIDASYLGYTPFWSTPVDVSGGPLQLPPFALQPAANTLQGVTVKAKKNYIERKIDRTVVNVDALISNAGANALEALEKAPGISVDANGGISLKGRSGVVVFIDDKPTYLSGTELDSYLKSLPAETIKQIEIMPNPPARYDAAGNAGVINIVTKRNQLQGLYGNVALGYTQGRYSRSNNSLNLNYNRKKVAMYSNVNFGIQNSFQDLNINRYYRTPDGAPLSAFNQNSYIEKKGGSASVKLGLDYFATARTTVGLSVKGLTNPNSSDTDNTALVRDANQELLNTVIADNVDESGFQNGTFSANLRHQIDSSGGLLTFDADYVRYHSSSDQVFKNYIYRPDASLDYADQLDGALPSNIHIYAAKTDLSKQLSRGVKLDAGLKSAFTQTDNEAIYTTTTGGVTVPNYDLSNQFLYDEWIHAAYLNTQKSMGQWEMQLGLRGEGTALKGRQLGNVEHPDSSFTRNYFTVFPTVYLLRKLDSMGVQTLTFSYGRRIDRPYFQDLNPFISPLDKFTFYTGNPNLLPTYSHNLSLTHSWKGTINTTLSYGRVIDGINETLEILDGIYYSRPNNTQLNTFISLSVEGNVPVTKWWNLNFYAEGTHVAYSGSLYTEQLDAKGQYCAFQLVNGLNLGKGWGAEVRGFYQSDVVYAQLLIKGYGTLNAAVKKTILKGKGSLRLTLNDILYTRRADGIINNLRLTDADWDSRLDSRFASVAFSYRFGKAQGEKKRYTGSGSESEQNRVKN